MTLCGLPMRMLPTQAEHPMGICAGTRGTGLAKVLSCNSHSSAAVKSYINLKVFCSTISFVAQTH